MKHCAVKRTLLIALLSLLLSFGAAAGPSHLTRTIARGVVAARSDARQESFDIVWTTVRDKHFDPTLGGLDWNKVREQYAPRAAAAKSDAEFYDVLRQMLGELHQSHFNIIPPEAIIQDDSREPKTGGIGIDIRLIDGHPIITRVEPGSKAAGAGLRTGFEITKIDGTPAETVIESFAKSKESDSKSISTLRITRALLARINGAPDTTVRIAYLDERNQPRETTITRQRLKGEMSPRVGNFPPQYSELEATRLAGGIGYIRFNVFVMSLLDRIRAAVRSMSDAPGVIIDVRGNPGGVGGIASGIAGVLEKEQTSLGTMHMRSGHINFTVFPQPNPYLGPVVILTDGGSASTSEIFAGGMQEIGRALVVGERTVGAALPSYLQKLPTGALFQYAIGDFKTPRGTLIEGRGVAPDVEVKLTRRSLLDGRDAQLDAAIEQIQKHSNERKAAAARSSIQKGTL